MSDYFSRKTCRICDSHELINILDLGITPLANAFVHPNNLSKKEKTFPLAVFFCQNCSLVQLPHVVDPKILFSDYYFITSASSPLLSHFKEYSKDILKRFIKSKEDLAVDIGGNDGTLLNELKNYCRVINVEPATNISEISSKKGIKTINDFFSKKVAKKIIKEDGHANIVTANNIIAHTDTVRELFEGVKELLTNDGVFIFETHWVNNLILEGAFDQVYHEHLSYYSLHALNHLVDSVDMHIFDVKKVPVQGESIRVFVSKNHKILPSVEKFLKEEKKIGLNKLDTFSDFSKEVLENKKKTVNLLKSLKSKNKKIVGYGAPAKASTLLNFYGVGNDLIDYVTDTTFMKQGMYVPGVKIPIFPPEKLNESRPDYILILAWNFADAILEKEKELRDSGIKFILPVPKVKII